MNNRNPLISVLMPVYNAEKYLGKAIESILNQSYKNFEFIIINDGSTDNSENIILSYHDNRIRYIKNDVNLCLIKTLNIGINLARGKYIARMDADDISMKNRLEKQLNCFQQNKEIDIVNSNCFLLDEDGKSYRKNRTYLVLSPEAIKVVSIFQTMIVHPAVMIKTSVLKKFKYKDEENVVHIEDYDLWNRLFENGKRCFTMSEVLLKYRLNSASITSKNAKSQNEKIKNLTILNLKKNYNRIIDLPTLSLIHYDLTYCSYKGLKNTSIYFSVFFQSLYNEKVISKSVLQELLKWKRHKILIIAFKSLKKEKFNKKIDVFYFLLTRLWFKDIKSFL